jgi:hypothetical protein
MNISSIKILYCDKAGVHTIIWSTSILFLGILFTSSNYLHLSSSQVLQRSPAEPIVSNAIPIAGNQSGTTNMNTPIDITLDASDNDTNDDLTADIVSIPSNGKLSDINQSTGFVTYTPDPGFAGDDQFTFKVNDGKTGSNNTGTVKIGINSEQVQSVSTSNDSNHYPIANNQSVTTNMNTRIWDVF